MKKVLFAASVLMVVALSVIVVNSQKIARNIQKLNERITTLESSVHSIKVERLKEKYATELNYKLLFSHAKTSLDSVVVQDEFDFSFARQNALTDEQFYEIFSRHYLPQQPIWDPLATGNF